jgi:hypothetical protein
MQFRSCLSDNKDNENSDGHHHIWVLDNMLWSFRGLFFYAKSDLLMVCRKIKPSLVMGDHELPTVLFDGPELAQERN